MPMVRAISVERMPLRLQFAHSCLVYRSRAVLVDASRLRLSDALKLALAAQVRLELGEHAVHIDGALAGCGARIDNSARSD
jgi:hypothetical protein